MELSSAPAKSTPKCAPQNENTSREAFQGGSQHPVHSRQKWNQPSAQQQVSGHQIRSVCTTGVTAGEKNEAQTRHSLAESWNIVLSGRRQMQKVTLCD